MVEKFGGPFLAARPPSEVYISEQIIKRLHSRYPIALLT